MCGALAIPVSSGFREVGGAIPGVRFQVRVAAVRHMTRLLADGGITVPSRSAQSRQDERRRQPRLNLSLPLRGPAVTGRSTNFRVVCYDPVSPSEREPGRGFGIPNPVSRIVRGGRPENRPGRRASRRVASNTGLPARPAAHRRVRISLRAFALPRYSTSSVSGCGDGALWCPPLVNSR